VVGGGVGGCCVCVCVCVSECVCGGSFGWFCFIGFDGVCACV
jgi:hypothetical protein